MIKHQHDTNQTPDLAQDLLSRALSIHAHSYLSGSFLGFDESITQQFIESFAGQLANEAQTLAHLHQRPLDKIIGSAAVALIALEAAVNDQREAQAAERARATQTPPLDDAVEVSNPASISQPRSSISFWVRA